MQITAANWLCLLTPSELLIYDRVNLLLLNNIIKNNIVFYADSVCSLNFMASFSCCLHEQDACSVL